MREDFLSLVVHELKAPLSSISAALELLDRRGASFGQTERTLLLTSMRNALWLRRLIDDLLDLASMRQGAYEHRPAFCDPGALVEEAVGRLRPWAQAKQVELGAGACVSAAGHLYADGPRIVQVLTNLLSNALKATPAGGKVEAGVERSGADWRFWVRDTGGGIRKEDQARIFEKFVQVHEGAAPREGAGLGLAIVTEIVGRHRGRIDVDSEPGRGSTFSVTIPSRATCGP
ncbi:MAG: HAMP domain-containing histidine kinase [Elusimicrobia bacterium]|nr:HAMP domain-containing histidine kinase [Elusimicrobiota bacterium]